MYRQDSKSRHSSRAISQLKKDWRRKLKCIGHCRRQPSSERTANSKKGQPQTLAFRTSGCPRMGRQCQVVQNFRSRGSAEARTSQSLVQLRMAELSPASQNPLSAKLTQVLGSSYTDYGVRQALESLDGTFTVNTTSSRRQLRAAFELRGIETSGVLLAQYEQVISVSCNGAIFSDC
jgi:hypothetical protein